ncbi:MAG: TetR-like C-terminal domain-containing protein [Eubacteriales bacterium]|nr:TetR-like C-terminal domain-containing protein [Eubacteriales bacterium]
MNHRENRRVRLTKQLIRDSLLELLQEKELHRICVRELCEKADINRSTFYQYYDSTYALLADMEEELLAEVSRSLSSMTQQSSDYDKLVHLLDFIVSHMTLCRLLIHSNVDPEFSERLLGLPAILGKLRSDFTGNDPSEDVYLQRFALHGSYEAIAYWLQSGCLESPEKIADIIYRACRKLLV